MPENFRITVPKEITPKAAHAHKVQPAGRHVATVTGIERLELDDGGVNYRIDWSFHAGRKDWTIDNEVDDTDLAEVLVNLGLAGQTVEPANIIGKKALLVVATYAGKSYAKVKEVRPLPASMRQESEN